MVKMAEVLYTYPADLPYESMVISKMTFDCDDTDWALLRHLQQDARVTLAQAGRIVGLTPPAVAERIRRLEEHGVIRGYHAAVDPTKLGRAISAFIRVRFTGGKYEPFERLIEATQEVLECHHITGEDCFIVKVSVATMSDLESVAAALSRFGPTATSVVYSTVIDRRLIANAHEPLLPANKRTVKSTRRRKSALSR
ncbi:MAG TPA: Lrp/AsnC family transcriptional regulator [Candidatus Baltobacteraceae bacterium]|jgi:Lrp/AsnC family leucine-responsive transcriptional regulator